MGAPTILKTNVEGNMVPLFVLTKLLLLMSCRLLLPLHSMFKHLLQECLSAIDAHASPHGSSSLQTSHGIPSTTKWIVDFDASSHISGNATLFSNITRHPSIPSVMLVDDYKTPS